LKVHILDFAKIIILHDDIAEVIINEGIEMTEEMVDIYHRFLIDNLRTPFSLLINKINDYTYDFQAQLKIANISNIHAMAVVTTARFSEVSTVMLAKTTPRKRSWNMQLFSDRQVALDWLEIQQDKVRSSFH
jgi:hypothetical protein